MLKHAVLAMKVREGQDDIFLAVPVVNFPVLPLGQQIDVYIGGTQFFEDAKIVAYKASNMHGTEVEIHIGDGPGARAEWDILAKLCEPDPGQYYNYAYPGVLDYGVPHPYHVRH